MQWIPIKNFGHIYSYRSYLISVWDAENESIYSMCGYVNTAGDWLNGAGERIQGEVYAIAEQPRPAPLIDFRMANEAAEKDPQ